MDCLFKNTLIPYLNKVWHQDITQNSFSTAGGISVGQSEVYQGFKYISVPYHL